MYVSVCVSACVSVCVYVRTSFLFFTKRPSPPDEVASQGIVCIQGLRRWHRIWAQHSRRKLTGKGWRPDHCVPDILYAKSLTLLFSEASQKVPGLCLRGQGS